MGLSVSRLFVYPVKSLAGIESDSLSVGFRGPRFDREWVVVGPDGVFLSQRKHPRMCLIACRLAEAALTLSAAGRPDLAVSLEAPGRARVTASVWGDACAALDEGDAAAAWLTAAIGAPCRLARIAPGFRRRLEEPYGRPGDWTAFADGFPLLAVTEESLADLGRRAGRTFEPERFRPNIVVRGGPAWSEDAWSVLRAGGVALRAAKPCERCAITTVDPRTGESGAEPLKTLAGFRRRGGGVLFGMNLVPVSEGVLRVGDALSA
ncbi:MAG: MOSC domain-containing protein [Elusimicrobia bacterium]|nr:MOSC domain-containing protein [Elusimicrobiota bacterium]